MNINIKEDIEMAPSGDCPFNPSGLEVAFKQDKIFLLVYLHYNVFSFYIIYNHVKHTNTPL